MRERLTIAGEGGLWPQRELSSMAMGRVVPAGGTEVDLEMACRELLRESREDFISPAWIDCPGGTQRHGSDSSDCSGLSTQLPLSLQLGP